MPALVQRARWETSQRPLFVKTVWQNGVRHAILSKDDPLFAKNEPAPNRFSKILLSQSAPEVPAPMRPRPSELERCLMKLQLVLASEPKVAIISEKKRSPDFPSPEEEVFPLLPVEAEEEPCPKRIVLEELETSSSETSSASESENKENQCEDEEDAEEFDLPNYNNWLPDLNPLSERVLQWLEREAKRNRPRVVDLRTLKRAQKSPMSRPSTQSSPLKQPRIRVKRKLPAKWSSKLGNNETLAITAQSVPRKLAAGLKPVITVTPVKSSPSIHWANDQQSRGRPQLHVFIPRIDSDAISDHSSDR
ncbi:uncharacterized protein LOC132203638 [Neocloeon triangulifer]|uniref:uncharacterized protein LOC132203638 n=1 Tax=Neocloeon triangulifer TaxID=2078957 RepID=UPI00286EC8C1|nr:uncharacterized protein LOC132203638 [Neocloeon triangulifer]